MLAEPGYHTRAFVEWEDWPRSVLIAAQRAGYFAPAPIWDDLRSFDARRFKGAFDTLLAGYPCQPLAAAHAWRTLAAAHGLGPLDLAADDGWSGGPNADEPL
jgi:site-specific DNA-cytosine methylase